MKKKRRIAAAVVIAAVSAASVRAFAFPDFALIALLENHHYIEEFTKAAQHAKTLAEAVKQVNAIRNLAADFTDYRRYLEVINGKWAQKIPGMERIGTVLARDTPGDLRNLGWDLELFDRAIHLRSKSQALAQLRSVIDAAADARGRAATRDSIEEVYGEVPVTEAGVPVEAAYREIATVTAGVGELTRRIEAKREQIASLRDELESGELAPGDIERAGAVIAAEQAELSILQTAAINNATRASVQQLGLAAAERRERVSAAITDRATRMRMAASLHFGLAGATDGGVE